MLWHMSLFELGAKLGRGDVVLVAAADKYGEIIVAVDQGCGFQNSVDAFLEVLGLGGGVFW